MKSSACVSGLAAWQQTTRNDGEQPSSRLCRISPSNGLMACKLSPPMKPCRLKDSSQSIFNASQQKHHRIFRTATALSRPGLSQRPPKHSRLRPSAVRSATAEAPCTARTPSRTRTALRSQWRLDSRSAGWTSPIKRNGTTTGKVEIKTQRHMPRAPARRLLSGWGGLAVRGVEATSVAWIPLRPVTGRMPAIPAAPPQWIVSLPPACSLSRRPEHPKISSSFVEATHPGTKLRR